MSIIDFFTDMSNPALAFLPRALLMAVMSSVLCGVVGTHVVLRGLSFVGDALSHAVFPGIAVSFALGTSTLIGGAATGIAVAVLIALFAYNQAVREDSLIGIFFTAAFALGLLIISRLPNYTGSLESLLFGSLTGVRSRDLLVVAAVGIAVLGLLLYYHQALLAVSFDRDYARAIGYSPLRTDLLLYLCIAISVVISVSTIGNILVIALLVAPAAAARMISPRVSSMMLIAPLIGICAAVIGMWVSWAFAVPTGAAIVLVVSVIFVLVWIVVALRTRYAARRRKLPVFGA